MVENFKGKSAGEDLFWMKCLEYLPDEYVSFHDNYIDEIHQFDVTILVPNYGVLIIEIKSYKAKNIINVPDRRMIWMKNNIPEGSPFEQVMNYRDILINYLSANDDSLKKIYVTGAVGYPYITEDEFFNKQLDKISSRRFAFLQEDLESKERFIFKIIGIFSYLYEEISYPNLEKYSLDNENLNKVGNLISQEFRKIFLDENTQKGVQEKQKARVKRTVSEVNSFVEYVKSDEYKKIIDDSAKKYKLPPKVLEKYFLKRIVPKIIFDHFGIVSETIEVNEETASKIHFMEEEYSAGVHDIITDILATKVTGKNCKGIHKRKTSLKLKDSILLKMNISLIEEELWMVGWTIDVRDVGEGKLSLEFSRDYMGVRFSVTVDESEGISSVTKEVEAYYNGTYDCKEELWELLWFFSNLE